MAKRTKAEALKTRQELIETAIAQFAQHGVSKTTLNDIADAANVTRGAIYWHFENKTQLFNEMWFARTVADRVIFMDRGEIVEQAAPNEFFAHPKSERTRTFLSQVIH